MTIYRLLSILLLLPPSTAWSWGGKGHEMQARAAVRKLPADMPVFFRQAEERLAYLVNEPDRWRDAAQATAEESFGLNHIFRWEVAPKPLPPDRQQFVAELLRQGKLTPEKPMLRDYGTALYAIVEWSEVLTGLFRRWRQASGSTPEQRARKRWVEEDILFMAGTLAHWVTDSSNPMHTSIHVSGWSREAPNPNGYEGKGLHSRFESAYVEQAIEQPDVDAEVSAEPRLLGCWLREMERYFEANNRHVEQIYRWDKQAPFGSGKEPPEAKPFTAARLADGARMLRDVWHSAWVKSGSSKQ